MFYIDIFFSNVFVLSPGPVADLQPVNITLANAIEQRITLEGNISVGIATLLVPRNTTTILISCAQAVPLGAYVGGLLVPVEFSTLAAALQSPLVGGVMWNGTVATSFTDRYVLHPDASGGRLPLRFLKKCTILTDGTTVSCVLPTNMTGSLWRIFVGWSVPLTPTMVVLPTLSPGAPLMSFGAPLLLSWAVPVLTPYSGRRFQPNFYGVRTPPSEWTPQTVPSSFETSGVAPNISNSVWSFPAIPTTDILEKLYFAGSFGDAPNSQSLQVILRYLDLGRFFFLYISQEV